jgi:predicted RNase H-like nuclease (RuvC/YqgF family)
MSIFNPWAEVRKLKAQLEAGYETYRVEETQQQAEWAEKDIMLKALGRENQRLRRELSNLSGPAKKISRLESNLKRRAGVVERRNVATKNSSLYAEETHRSAQLAKTLKEQDALVIMLQREARRGCRPTRPRDGPLHQEG